MKYDRHATIVITPQNFIHIFLNLIPKYKNIKPVTNVKITVPSTIFSLGL
jgi:hypothetical protein